MFHLRSVSRKASARTHYALRTLMGDSGAVKEKRVGIIGMGNVGTAVANNLLKNDYKLTSIIDVDLKKCEGYPCKVAKTPREVTKYHVNPYNCLGSWEEIQYTLLSIYN